MPSTEPKTDHFELPSGALIDTIWTESATTARIDNEMDLIIRYLMRLAAIRNARAPLLKLAPELLDMIFDWLYDEADTQAIHSCSLVCQRFTHPAQSRMFSSFRLVTRSDIANGLQIAREMPDIYATCRKLTIGGNINDDPDVAALDGQDYAGVDNLVTLLSPLKLVQELHLVDASPACSLLHTTALPILAGMFSRATKLTLSDFFFDDAPAFDNLMAHFKQLRSLTIDDGVFEEDAMEGRSVPPFVNLRRLTIQCCDISIFGFISPFVTSNSLTEFIIRVQDAQSPAFRSICKDIVARCSGSLRRLCISPDSVAEIQYILGGLPQDSPCLTDIALDVDWLVPDHLAVLQGLQGPRIHSLKLDRTILSWNPVTLPKLLQVHDTVRSVWPLAALGTLSLQMGTINDSEPTILEADLVGAGCLRLRSDRRIITSPFPDYKFLEERKYTYNISSTVAGGEHVVLHIYRTLFLDSCRTRVPETVTQWCFAIIRGLEATNSDDWYTT